MPELTQSEFNDLLKRMSKVYLKIIIPSIGLKNKYEQILWLIYVEELSYSQIADKLKMTRESVGNLATKAKKELKYLIDKQDILLPDNIRNYIQLFKSENI